MCCDAWILLYPNGENRALISVAGRRNVVTSIALSDLLSVIDELYRFGAIAARNLQEERENDDTVGGDDESVDRPDPLAGNGQGAV
jgi:hypothetical protein